MNARQIRIEVNRGIHLSEFHPNDKPALVKYLNDREIYDHTLRIPNPYTEDHADEFLNSLARATAKDGHLVHFAIRGSDGQLIGGCGFDGLSYGHRAEIGYWLAKPYWGQGIITEVLRAACAFAFDQWKLVRITAHVFTFNDRSSRVLEKCGFQLEGILRKHQCKAGMFLDSKLYALVK